MNGTNVYQHLGLSHIISLFMSMAHLLDLRLVNLINFSVHEYGSPSCSKTTKSHLYFWVCLKLLTSLLGHNKLCWVWWWGYSFLF